MGSSTGVGQMLNFNAIVKVFPSVIIKAYWYNVIMLLFVRVKALLIGPLCVFRPCVEVVEKLPEG